MKPRLSYSDFAAQRWMEAYERIRALGKGAKYTLGDLDLEVDHIGDDPHPPTVWVKYRDDGKVQHAILRKGDPLLLEMKPQAQLNDTQ